MLQYTCFTPEHSGNAALGLSSLEENVITPSFFMNRKRRALEERDYKQDALTLWSVLSNLYCCSGNGMRVSVILRHVFQHNKKGARIQLSCREGSRVREGCRE